MPVPEPENVLCGFALAVIEHPQHTIKIAYGVNGFVDEHFPLTAGELWLRNTKVIPILGAPYSHRDELLKLIAAGKIDAAQIITDRKSGKWVNYSLADKKVLEALKTLGP